MNCNLIAIKRTIADFATHCDRILQRHLGVGSVEKGNHVGASPEADGLNRACFYACGVGVRG